MLFLETDEIDKLEMELDESDVPFNKENLEKEIERLKKLRNKMPSKTELSLELGTIEARAKYQTYGISNWLKKIQIKKSAKKLYIDVRDRFNRTCDLLDELNGRIEDFVELVEIFKEGETRRQITVSKQSTKQDSNQSNSQQIIENC